VSQKFPTVLGTEKSIDVTESMELCMCFGLNLLRLVLNCLLDFGTVSVGENWLE